MRAELYRVLAYGLAGLCVVLLLTIGGMWIYTKALKADIETAQQETRDAKAQEAICTAGMNKLKADAAESARLRAEAAEKAAVDIATANDRIAKLATMRGENCDAVRAAVDVFWEGRK